MRKLAVVLALASTALATPALARDNSWYVGVEAGAMLVEDLDFDVGAANNALTVDSEYGYDADAVIGYDFGGFRLEAEVAYKRARVDEITSSVTIPFAGRNAPAGTYDFVGGSTSALSFMLNGMLDFGDDEGIQGFIGGGVGVARVKAHDYAFNQRGGFVDDSDTVFAWQGIAGIRAPLTPNVDATLKYRFFNADDIRLVDVTNRQLETRFRSHSILGGLTFNFGEPPAPPPPPPP
ncbi:MAG TPA: outer membrane beta-barrel protein, partial [Sphingomonas sp.]